MEPERSLPRLQQPTTCPYPEPDQTSPCSPSHILEIHLNIILLFICLCLQVGLFPSGPSIPVPSPPIHATCLAHPILPDFIAHKIFGEAYRSLSSSFCIFPHPCYPVPLRSKYPPQYPLLKLPQPTFLPNGSNQVSHTFKQQAKLQYSIS